MLEVLNKRRVEQDLFQIWYAREVLNNKRRIEQDLFQIWYAREVLNKICFNFPMRLELSRANYYHYGEH